LYNSTVADFTRETPTQAGSRPRPRHASEDLRETFGSLFDSLTRRTDLARLLVSESQKSGPAQGVYGQIIGRFLNEIRRVIVEGQRHGYFRDDVDPERVAQQALVLALGYVALERVLEPLPDTTKARTWRDATADLLVRALGW
jgi:hypothetical protein